jgi:hypothetical protein
VNQTIYYQTIYCKTRSCRTFIASSRVRRQRMAEKFDQQWRELRLYATIERDSQKLEKLIADFRNANR